MSVVTVNSEQELEDLLNAGTIPNPIVIDKGIKYTVYSATGGVSDEAQDVLDRFTGLSGIEEAAIITLVDSEVANGNWGLKANGYVDGLYDAFWCFGLGTEAQALTQWHPTSIALGAVNNGATKGANGFQFTGTEWIDTGFNPSTDGVNFLLNNALWGIFLKDNPSPNSQNMTLMTARDASARSQIQTNTPDVNYGANENNSRTHISGAIANNSLALCYRTAVNSVSYSLNGTVQDSDVLASTLIPNSVFEIGRRPDNASTFLIGTVSSAIIGATNGFDQSGFNSNLVTLLTSLGVLP